MVTPAAAGRPGADTALHIAPGMEVYDTFDHKLGTVAHLHEGPLGPGGAPGANDVVEVKTGFLGLGKHLFIPRSGIRDVTEGGVFVAASRDELHQHGWDQRPASLGGAGGSLAQPSPDAAAGTAGAPVAASATGTAGAAPGAAVAPATWAEASPRYQARYEQRYGSGGSGARWETYEPRYRFAWEAGRSPELAGTPWAQAEPELRRRWEVLHPDTEWGTAAETLRDAWEHGGSAGPPRAA